MAYLAYHFIVDPVQPGSEILSALIAEMGFDSFDHTENGFTAYILEELQAQVQLAGLEFEDFNYHYTIEHIAQENWNEEWEKNFEPVKVDDLLLIRAPFHKAESGFKEEIVIMPKMSFGTGHHQTTRLMCRQLFESRVKDARVLDMGCGTGILAILAKKLGASSVLGIDIDDWSVENAIENCASNGFPDIDIVKGDVDLLHEHAAFDFILANINKNVLRKHMPSYSKKLTKGGHLFLSGFFVTDVEDLKAICAAEGLAFVSVKHEEEWAMVHFTKS